MATQSAKTVKKLLEFEVRHSDWISKTSKDLGLYQREVISAVFDYAMTHNIMEGYKTKVTANKLEKTLVELEGQAKLVAQLQERAQNELRTLQKTDGKGN